MTRAALLQLLDSPASLSAAAVQDLEQLAQAFPYCQTAHLLLAKAAHDQGSMLANQRLRRAATYAADRQLLRQLLERPAPSAYPTTPVSSFTPIATPADQGGVEVTAEASTAEAVATPTLVAPPGPVEGVGNEPTLAAEAPEAELLTTAIEPPAETETATEATGVLVAATSADSETAGAPPLEAIEIEGEVSDELTAAPLLFQEISAQVSLELIEAVPALAATTEESSAQSTAAEMFLADTSAEKNISAETTTIAEPATIDETVAVAAAIDTAEVTAGTDEAEADSLPPIRPPAEAGMARCEFGLSAPALAAEFTVYQLPEALDDATAMVAARPAAPTAAAPTAFRGAEELAYALGDGSRLGYAMQLAFAADVNSADANNTDMTAGWAATAGPPGSVLPAAGELFPPDALLLEHLASQPPPVPSAPSSLELIDSFLRRAPQRRRGIVTLLTVPEQADLSMRSTRAEPDLASESLARILAGQGKTERAIAVYERLMVRQPEKSAYFAVQIELLRNPPTPSS